MNMKEFLAEVTEDYVYSELRGRVAIDLMDKYGKEDDGDLIRYMEDISTEGGINGMIPSLVYHDQTEEFFKSYDYDIFQLSRELEFNKPISEFDSMADFYDTMAWFAYEETVYKLLEEYRELVGEKAS